MGFLDRLLGRREAQWSSPPPRESEGPGPSSEDERALERYRYLVRTAPPERIEQAHEEAFAKLTPQQRRLALEELSREVPARERATADDPRSLARMATRAELRDPGTVERAFGRGSGGFGGGVGAAASEVGSAAGSGAWACRCWPRSRPPSRAPSPPRRSSRTWPTASSSTGPRTRATRTVTPGTPIRAGATMRPATWAAAISATATSAAAI